MYNGSNDLFNFKPHEIDPYKHLTAYTGLAWQFNYQKSKKKATRQIVGSPNLLAPYCRLRINYKKLSTAF